MDERTKGLADQADAAFSKHFDGCERCRFAFARGLIYDGMCGDGLVLHDKALEIHDGWAIEHLDETMCRIEILLEAESPHQRSVVSQRLRQQLQDRLRKLTCKRCS